MLTELQDFSFLAPVAGFVIAISLLIAKLVDLVNNVKKLKSALRERTTVIGLVHCPVPSELRHLPDYTDIKLAIVSSSPIVLLHCRTLSYALIHCDFVCADAGDDPKIIQPNDHEKLEAICCT